jgi:RNA polymerase sigma factor for flagellar operon FliA
MFDRQSYPPLPASTFVEGAVATRPISGAFSDRTSGQVLDPLVKQRSCVSDPGVGGSPPGGGVDLGADRARASVQTASPEAAAVETEKAASPAEVGNAAVPAGVGHENGAARSAPHGGEASDAEEGNAAGDGSPADGSSGDGRDLSGYGVYGCAAAVPGLGLTRDELVTRYAHLVKYVVGRLGVSVPGLFDHEDAMQAGVVGLLRAIDAYRPESAASFESYAILRIRGSILDAVRALDTVGRAGREAARAIQAAIRDLQHELGRSPTETEIAARLGMPVARYRERLQAASIVTVSLDEHDAHDDSDESIVLADNAPDPNAVDPAEEAARKDAIASMVQEIGRLGQRPRMVLALYYQDEMTFKEIGQVLGVTESRVCQIHTEAILALRSRLVDPDVAARLGRRRVRQ